jgi:copper chaperone
MSDDRTLTVSGMSCTGCEANVEEALGGLDGVERVDADHEADTVSLTLSGTVSDADVEEAVREAGYTVEA